MHKETLQNSKETVRKRDGNNVASWNENRHPQTVKNKHKIFCVSDRIPSRSDETDIKGGLF